MAYMSHEAVAVVSGASAAGGMRGEPTIVAASPLQRRPLPSARRHLLQLPAEHLVCILSFLPAPDVARSCATSRAFRAAAESPALWRLLYASDFDALTAAADASSPTPQLSQPKHAYTRRLQARQRRVAVISDNRRTEAANEVAKRAGDALVFAINSFNVCAFIFAPFLLLLIFTAILAAQLDGVIAWSWMRVFAPIIALAAVIAVAAGVAIVVLVCVKRWEGSTTSAWARVDLERLQWAPTIAVIQGIAKVPARVARGRPVFAVHFIVFLCALLFIPIAIAWKLDAGGMSWTVALIPTWVAIATYCCAGCCGWLTVARERESSIVIYLVSLAALLLPLLIVLILVVVSLDGIKSISTQLTFIPWWILLGSLLLPLCLGVCVAVGKAAYDREVSEAINALAGILFSCTLLVPPTITLVLLTLRVQGVGTYAELSWAKVLAPIMFLLGLLVIVTCLVATSACVRRCRAAARRRESLGGGGGMGAGADSV